MWQRLSYFFQSCSDYLTNIGTYHLFGQLRHTITGPLRMGRANRLRKAQQQHKEEEREREQARQAQFFPIAASCPAGKGHPPYVVSGFPDAPCPACIREQKQKETEQLWKKYYDPEHPGKLGLAWNEYFSDQVPTLKETIHHTPQSHPVVRLTRKLVEGEQPERVTITEEERKAAQFLLDQQQGDPDETVKKPVVRKAG